MDSHFDDVNEEAVKKRKKKKRIPIDNPPTRRVIVPLPELTQLELTNAYKSELHAEREMFAPRYSATEYNSSKHSFEMGEQPTAQPKWKRPPNRIPLDEQKIVPLFPRVPVGEYARQQAEERRMFIPSATPGMARNELAVSKNGEGEWRKRVDSQPKQAPQQPGTSSSGEFRRYSTMWEDAQDHSSQK